MKAKRTASLLLAVALCLSLTACTTSWEKTRNKLDKSVRTGNTEAMEASIDKYLDSVSYKYDAYARLLSYAEAVHPEIYDYAMEKLYREIMDEPDGKTASIYVGTLCEKGYLEETAAVIAHLLDDYEVMGRPFAEYTEDEMVDIVTENGRVEANTGGTKDEDTDFWYVSHDYRNCTLEVGCYDMGYTRVRYFFCYDLNYIYDEYDEDRENLLFPLGLNEYSELEELTKALRIPENILSLMDVYTHFDLYISDEPTELIMDYDEEDTDLQKKTFTLNISGEDTEGYLEYTFEEEKLASCTVALYL